VDQASQRDLKILTEISERQDITQRGPSESPGIALGLTNLYQAPCPQERHPDHDDSPESVEGPA